MEVANGLQMAMRRRRVDAPFRDTALAQLRRLRIEIDAEADQQAWSGSVRLADQFQLTVYDATYLERVPRRRVARATLDRALRGGRGAWRGHDGGDNDAAAGASQP